MKDISNDKLQRVLGIYTKLLNGKFVSKSEEAFYYGVNERSIQRDIHDIRNYIEVNDANTDYTNTVIYDHYRKGYYLKQRCIVKFTKSEILAICKILLGSRAFIKQEMKLMLDKLISCCGAQIDQNQIKELISNELFNYVGAHHKRKFLDNMWKLVLAIKSNNYIEINYERSKDKKIVKRKLQPLAIMFSEFYFYLAAVIDDESTKANFEIKNDTYPTIYRIDRMKAITILSDKFHIPYRDKFEEGEFRNKIQFMYGGKLQTVKFNYYGTDIDAILDRLPTAKIVKQENNVYMLTAEVFGKGIDMWFRGQGDMIKRID